MPAADGSIPFDEPFDVQVARARARGVQLPDAFYALKPEKRALAFTVSGLARLDQVQAVADSLTRAQAEGWSFARWKAWAQEQDWSLPRHRLETIFRTNMQTNYMAGHWRHFEMNRARRQWLMFDAINDSRVRPNHLALDGVIRHIDDAVWDRISPPLGFNCRCTLRALTDRAARRRGGRTESVPAEGHADGPGWGKRPHYRAANIAHVGDEKAARSSIIENSDIARSVFERMMAGASPSRVSESMLRDVIGDALWDEAMSVLAGRNLPASFSRLNDVEKVALHVWTRDVDRTAWFRRINSFLRHAEAPSDTDILVLVVAMRSALSKLPPAGQRLLFRGEKIGRIGVENYLERFPEGRVISPGGFIATTPRHDRTLKGAVSIVINGDEGRWIAPLSAYPEQDEILFDPAIEFMVDHVIRTKWGATIWLKQL